MLLTPSVSMVEERAVDAPRLAWGCAARPKRLARHRGLDAPRHLWRYMKCARWATYRRLGANAGDALTGQACDSVLRQMAQASSQHAEGCAPSSFACEQTVRQRYSVTFACTLAVKSMEHGRCAFLSRRRQQILSRSRVRDRGRDGSIGRTPWFSSQRASPGAGRAHACLRANSKNSPSQLARMPLLQSL